MLVVSRRIDEHLLRLPWKHDRRAYRPRSRGILVLSFGACVIAAYTAVSAIVMEKRVARGTPIHQIPSFHRR